MHDFTIRANDQTYQIKRMELGDDLLQFEVLQNDGLLFVLKFDLDDDEVECWQLVDKSRYPDVSKELVEEIGDEIDSNYA